MTEQDARLLVEVDARSKSNCHRLDTVEQDIKELRNDQKAIYEIATSVKLIAQQVANTENKVDDLGTKVENINTRISEAETMPDKKVADNWEKIKWGLISAIATFIVTGALSSLIAFGVK